MHLTIRFLLIIISGTKVLKQSNRQILIWKTSFKVSSFIHSINAYCEHQGRPGDTKGSKGDIRPELTVFYDEEKTHNHTGQWNLSIKESKFPIINMNGKLI